MADKDDLLKTGTTPAQLDEYVALERTRMLAGGPGFGPRFAKFMAELRTDTTKPLPEFPPFHPFDYVVIEPGPVLRGTLWRWDESVRAGGIDVIDTRLRIEMGGQGFASTPRQVGFCHFKRRLKTKDVLERLGRLPGGLRPLETKHLPLIVAQCPGLCAKFPIAAMGNFIMLQGERNQRYPWLEECGGVPEIHLRHFDDEWPEDTRFAIAQALENRS